MSFPSVSRTPTIQVQAVHIARADDADLGASVLSASEAARTARFRDPLDRARFIVGRVLVRTIIGASTKASPAEVVLEIGPRGKPACPATDIEFSLAHAGPWVVMAWSPGAAVGVDIEADAARVGASEAAFRKALHPHERARVETLTQSERDIFMTRTWVMKEAIAKATGDGLGLPFAEIELDLAGPGVRFHGAAAARAGTWHLFERGIEGAYCAVAMMSEHSPKLRLHPPIQAVDLIQAMAQ